MQVFRRQESEITVKCYSHWGALETIYSCYSSSLSTKSCRLLNISSYGDSMSCLANLLQCWTSKERKVPTWLSSMPGKGQSHWAVAKASQAFSFLTTEYLVQCERPKKPVHMGLSTSGHRSIYIGQLFISLCWVQSQLWSSLGRIE